MAANENGLYLAGAAWELECKYKFIDKAIRAAVIELTGEEPEQGERYLATKDGNQYEIGKKMTVSPYVSPGNKGVVKTNILLENANETKQRVYQSTVDKRIYLLNEKYAEMISNENIDFDAGESVLERVTQDGAFLKFKNDVMQMNVCMMEDDLNEEVIIGLCDIDCGEKP